MACGCPTYKLYCKRKGANDEKDYCVTVRDDILCLALPNNSDPAQLWQKFENRYSGFMLVNKATDKAVKYQSQGDQLILVNKPLYLDKTVLWDESEDIILGYKYIRTQTDLNMVMDAWERQVSDGAKISIYPEKKNVNDSNNQLWKFVLA